MPENQPQERGQAHLPYREVISITLFVRVNALQSVLNPLIIRIV